MHGKVAVNAAKTCTLTVYHRPHLIISVHRRNVDELVVQFWVQKRKLLLREFCFWCGLVQSLACVPWNLLLPLDKTPPSLINTQRPVMGGWVCVCSLKLWLIFVLTTSPLSLCLMSDNDSLLDSFQNTLVPIHISPNPGLSLHYSKLYRLACFG